MRYSHRILLTLLSLAYLFLLGSIIIPSQVKSDEGEGFTFLSQIPGLVNDLVVKDNVLYVAGWETIRAFDISDKLNPIQISQYYEKDCNFLALDTEGNRLYATQGYYKCGYHLRLFDISNRLQISSISDGIVISNTGSPKEMVVQNAIVYIAYAQAGLSIIDASDSTSPVVYPLYKALPTITSDDVFIRDTVVYLPNTTGGFVAISVSNPGNPELILDYDLPTGSIAQYNSTGLVVEGNVVILAAGGKGLKLFDISDKQNIQTVTVPVNGYVRDVDGGLASLYAASDSISSTVGGIYSYVFDDISSGLFNDLFTHSATNKFYKVVCDGKYVYGIDVNEGVFILDSGLSDGVEESNAFLDLPWDYASKGMTFTEAALSMSTYFDHEYPFLSMPSLLNLDKSYLVNFEGEKNSINKYSSHDGYDWGRNAGTKYGIPQTAAADGIATYVDTCKACGNAIYINHGNGFQTRYYHLQDAGLITSDPEVSVPVVQGQQIGLTGFTGHTIPSDERGSHIHFMVIEDKDGDGQFNDNIPDGLVDPFGWQSSNLDPWESMTFELNEVMKTGNKSDYLWIHTMNEESQNVADTGGESTLSRYKVVIPETAYSGVFTLDLSSSPIIILNESTNSISPALVVLAHDASGNNITQFDDDIIIYFDFNDLNLSEYDLSTLHIYSSSDGETWVREETIVDLDNKVASTQVSHLTEFALFADLADREAPTTYITIDNENIEDSYQGDVQVSLRADDSENEIAYTTYSVDGSEWQLYRAPFEIAGEGSHTVEYYSEDSAGNVEDIKSQIISLRHSFPELQYVYDFSSQTLELTAFASSDIAQTIYYPRSKFETTVSNSIDTTVIKGHYKYGLIDYIKIDSVTYNDDLFVTENNALLIIDSFIVTNQTFSYDDLVVDLLSSRLRNKTVITEGRGRSKDRIHRNGLVPLYIRTNNGVLEYSYE